MFIREQTISILLPELVLIIAAVLIIVCGAFWRARVAWSGVAALITVSAGFYLARMSPSFEHFMGEWSEGPLAVDRLALVGRWLALLVGLLLLLMGSRRANELQGGEWPGLILFITAGLSLTCIAATASLLFVSLELVSIPTYAILFLGRSHASNAEATLKYFLLSILSSVIFLMGLAGLFGLTGSLEFSQMANAWPEAVTRAPISACVSLIFVFLGLSFKLTVVPFHFYAPDVYQGTSHVNAGLLAVVPKIAGLVALIRVLTATTSATSGIGLSLLAILAMISMTLGNFSALWQQNIRRMMAYSSIAHGGYILLGIAIAAGRADAAEHWFDGYGVAVLYTVIYAIASLGTFAVLTEISAPHREVEQLEQLTGLWPRRPVLALALAVSMFSLSGIPPLAGFWGKFGLIAGTLESAGRTTVKWETAWYLALSLVAMLNAAAAAAYYLRVVSCAFFRRDGLEDVRQDQPIGGGAMAAVATALLTLIWGLWPGPLMGQMEKLHASPSAAEASSRSGVHDAIVSRHGSLQGSVRTAVEIEVPIVVHATLQP